METVNHDVLEQIDLIDRMIREGRRSAEKWGWVFVLWGVAHVCAFIWSKLWISNPNAPWVIVTVGSWLLQMAIMIRLGRAQQGKSTTLGRAVSGSWAAFGICMIFVLIAGIWKHVFSSDEAFVGSFFVLLGGANLSSGVTLRFPAQVAVGLIWWLGALALMLLPEAGQWIFAGEVLLCEIGFGLYLMSLEKKAELDHA